MHKSSALLLLGLFCFAAGCASIGNPFTKLTPDYSTVPEEELRAFAGAVEQFVLQGEREPTFEDYPSIATDNEEIRQAIRTRAARAEILRELLDTGFAYEQKSGTVSIIRSRDYKPRAQAGRSGICPARAASISASKRALSAPRVPFRINQLEA